MVAKYPFQVIKRLVYGFWNGIYSRKDQQNLFLLAHPRSGSTMLMHILCSNPEILGFGEHFITYDCTDKFIEAEFNIRRKNSALFRNFKYIANQVNAPRLIPDLELIKSKGCKCIILLREPEAALSSLKRLSREKKKEFSDSFLLSVYTDPLNYFCSLTSVVDHQNWIFTTYEALVSNPLNELKKITEFLELNNELLPTYGKQKFTLISGDASDAILKFKIIDTKAPKEHFDKKILRQAKLVFEKTIQELRSKKRLVT